MRLVILLLSGPLLSAPVAAQQNGLEARVGKALISGVARSQSRIKAGDWHLDIATPEGVFAPWWRSLLVRFHGDQEVTETIVADPGKSQRILLMSALSKQ